MRDRARALMEDKDSEIAALRVRLLPEWSPDCRAHEQSGHSIRRFESCSSCAHISEAAASPIYSTGPPCRVTSALSVRVHRFRPQTCT